MDLAKNILVANDFGELGRGLMDQAVALAERLDAKLNVVTVYESHGPGPAALSRDPELRELREDMKKLEAELKPGGRLAHAAVHYGKAAETILQVAKDLQADLIVIGTHGRRGFNSLAMGSTAEEVLRAAAVPVLVFKKSVLARIDASES